MQKKQNEAEMEQMDTRNRQKLKQKEWNRQIKFNRWQIGTKKQQ